MNNLDENTTEEDLREYFKDCGTIEKVTLRMDKGYGFLYSYIQFTEPAAVEDAILLSEGMIRGRKIKVHFLIHFLRFFLNEPISVIRAECHNPEGDQ